ncbi:hypothetical protein FDP41_012740 [Naegleria fowleri]|uniref:Uncharacterized protein n=1 Tax=Naegleria fowleri TaxID=5763 RepID=A0A6A5C2G6_NAEFO|nr:uncharacterized protein FDP41_012740 [Naegleria fowleri]KAF0980952.1 hypothetical protein FDP41_012740 [Naegleria fowleri]
MKDHQVSVVADFLKKKQKERNNKHQSVMEEEPHHDRRSFSSYDGDDAAFDIGLIFSIPFSQKSSEEEEDSNQSSSSSIILVHHVSLISTLEEKAKNGGFSNLSSEWFHQQIQIVQQSLLSSVNISGMYLRDYSYSVKDRLNDVIALYMRSIESLQPIDATNPVYFINLLKEGQDVYLFEKGKFRQDMNVILRETSEARKLSEYSCVLPYYKKLRASKNIDALLDEIENQLENSLENDYIWKINKTTKRIECFLKTRMEPKLPEINQEGDMIEIVLCGTISGMVLTLDDFSYSHEDLIKEIKKDIVQGITTRIAFDDQLSKGISNNSVINRNLLKRFYIHDSATNIIYCDYSEDVDSIGIIEVIPSLIDQVHAYVVDVEGNTFSKKKLYDESSKGKVTEAKESKEGKTTSETSSSTSSSSEGMFAWFFAFIAFLLSLLGIKKQVQSSSN